MINSACIYCICNSRSGAGENISTSIKKQKSKKKKTDKKSKKEDPERKIMGIGETNHEEEENVACLYNQSEIVANEKVDTVEANLYCSTTENTGRLKESGASVEPIIMSVFNKNK